MPALFFKTRFLIAVLFAAILLAIGCKKTIEHQTEDILQQYFEQNILNRDFKVVRAIDDTVHNYTADYLPYIFRLEKNTTTNSNTDGPMNAKVNGSIVCTGTWSCTENWGKLGISLTLPTTPPAFPFINRSWKFTEKAFPVMKLAPWGTAVHDTLYMERQ